MHDVPIELKEAEKSSDNSQSQSNKREHSETPPGSPRQPSLKRVRRAEPREKKSPLLQLPPELRNQIYNFAFTRSFVRITGQSVYGYTCVRSKFLWKCKNVRHYYAGNEEANLPVAFLGACKQVHAEARAVLYANDFDMEGMETLAVWLKDLGTNTACLRTITLRTEAQMRLTLSSSSSFRAQQDRYREVCHRAARMLAGAENLQALGIHFFYNQMIGAPAPRAILKRPEPVSGWIGIARRVAEVLYHDFRSVYSKGLSRGRTPEDLCRVIKVSRNNWWCNRHALTPHKLNAKEAREAEEELGLQKDGGLSKLIILSVCSIIPNNRFVKDFISAGYIRASTLPGISRKESAIDNPQPDTDTALASINSSKPAEHLLKIPVRVWPRPRTPPFQTADSIDGIPKVLQSPYWKRFWKMTVISRNARRYSSTSRIRISGELAYTLVSSKRSTFRLRRGNLTQFPFTEQVDLSILQTCKQVLAEARSIVYSRTIDITDEETLLVWLRDIGPDNRSHLRDIALLMPSTYPQCPFISVRQKMVMTRNPAMLESSPNLKRIRMNHLGFEGMIDVNKRLKLHRDERSSPLVTASRHMAKWMSVFFRPLLCSPSFRSRSPSELSSLLVLEDRAYDTWHLLRNNKPGFGWPSLKRELDEAHASFTEHMELLLERSRKKNLRRRQKKLQRRS
ncbi:hypothetical protein BDP55DRAFT_742458 [Colletotrichum godetiae]|uniref:DUF7730 domain-containing protein n=1 Tax=Colletotrichum godetiae TaxID=1209918 RepID=A0AAJ0EUM2_9PEZI|nr:uncharacterized protein BDP55DRAFT_742458 [Colletotrichum godetiae]KAK1676357.1 hypothetical protein BDP55DRAFT_742458 [Colletotrichum godetiae]